MSIMIYSPVVGSSQSSQSKGPDLPLRRVETFEIDDQDCAEETYEHWSSLPTFLEAKMYLCPIVEIITVTAFFAQTLPPDTFLYLRRCYAKVGDYPLFGDESVVLAEKKKEKARRKKAKAKSQYSGIKEFSGRLEVVF